MCEMKKIYKFCIGALLGTITVSCVDQLDSDKNFKDRMTLEDVFTNEKYSEEWLAHAYSYLKGENMDVGTKDNILWCFADDIYFGEPIGDFNTEDAYRALVALAGLGPIQLKLRCIQR